jgi:phenylacetate-CoA ligase
MPLVRCLPRFIRANQMLPILAERECWSRQQIEAFQVKRLNEVWQHALTHVPYYRELRAKSKLPPQFGSLAEFQAAVPTLGKDAVRAEPKRFLSDRPRHGSWRRTGGSTGMPMSVFVAKRAHLEMLATQYRFYQMWGVGIFDRSMFLWGHADLLAPGLSGYVARLRQPLEDWLRNRRRLSVYSLGRDVLRSHLARIQAFRPRSLYGFSQAVLLLAQEARASGFRCDSLKLVTLAGEPAPPALLREIEDIFGVPTVIEYGATECGLIAQQWPDRTLRVREDVVLVETQAREDGRCALVVSGLNNPSFPLLRYEIGDMTESPLERPERGFAVLKNILGRNNDILVTRSGGYLHSSRLEALFKFYRPKIRRFRVRQCRNGEIVVAVEPDGIAATFDSSGLQRSMGDLVEGFPVSVEIVAAIPQTAAGKHRLVTSDMVAISNGAGPHPFTV